YISADAKINVPTIVPFIGGTTLASVDFVFDYTNLDPNTGQPSGYLAAWIQLDIFTRFDVGFIVDIDTSVHSPRLIGPGTVKAIENGKYVPQSNINEYISAPIPVPTGATTALLTVTWPQAKGVQHVAYEYVPAGGRPQTNIIPQSQYGTGTTPPSALGANGSGRNYTTTELVGSTTDPNAALPPGTYYYYLYSTEKF